MWHCVPNGPNFRIGSFLERPGLHARRHQQLYLRVLLARALFTQSAPRRRHEHPKKVAIFGMSKIGSICV